MSQTPGSGDGSDGSQDGQDQDSGPSYSEQVSQSAEAATEALQDGWLEYAANSKGGKTKMSLGGVALPGVYEIESTAKGYTAKYIAEKNEARSQATNYQGPQNIYNADRPPGAFPQGTLLNANGDPLQNNAGNNIIIASNGPSIINGSSSGDSTLLVVMADGTPFQDANGNDLTIQSGEAQIADGQGNPVTVTGPTETPPSPDSGNDSDSGNGSGDGNDSGSDDSSDSGGQQGGSGSDTNDGSAAGSSAQDLPPPPKEFTIRAYCTDQTWDKLDALREERTPLAVGVGEFTIDDCGITDLSADVDILGINDVEVSVKQHRQVIVQAASPSGNTDSTNGDTPSDTPGGSLGPNDGTPNALDYSFDQGNWESHFQDTYRTIGGSETTSQPANGTDGSVLQIQYESGSHYGVNVRYLPAQAADVEPDHLYGQFDIYIPTDFTFADSGGGGTKAPGFGGIYDGAGKGGDPGNGTSWSARMHTERGSSGTFAIRYYVYHMNQDGQYGDAWDSRIELDLGRWHRITQYIEMNDPGSANGKLAYWVNSNPQPVWTKEDLEFRDNTNTAVRSYYYDFRFGGNWPSPTTQSMYSDNVACGTNDFRGTGYGLGASGGNNNNNNSGGN